MNYFNSLFIMMLFWITLGSSHAMLPVIDASSLAKLIEQYKMQVKQYQNLQDNTKSLSDYQWDDASSIINKLIQSTDTLSEFKAQSGGLEQYLSRYQHDDYYRQSPCFHGGCSKEEWDKLRQRETLAFKAQKRTHDAMIRGLDRQQENLAIDAKRLKRLQEQAQTAEGQKQALQAASQLASAQINQLLQIRNLLVAAYTAQMTFDAARANKEAIQAAGDARFRAGVFKKVQAEPGRCFLQQ